MCLNHISIQNIGWLIIYQIFVYFATGFAILLLFEVPLKTDVEWIGVSFVSGYIFNIILYFLIVPFQWQQYSKLISLTFGAIALVVIYLKRKIFQCVYDNEGMIICSVATVVLMAIMFLCYNATGLTPGITGRTDYFNYHRDILYWIGNLNSLIKQWQPINPREYTAGVFNYHYFSSIQLSVQCLFTGISTVVTCLGTYFYTTTVMMVFGAYLVTRQVTKNIKISVIAIVVLLFTTGVENYTKMSWVAHFVLSSFGTNYALGF